MVRCDRHITSGGTDRPKRSGHSQELQDVSGWPRNGTVEIKAKEKGERKRKEARHLVASRRKERCPLVRPCGGNNGALLESNIAVMPLPPLVAPHDKWAARHAGNDPDSAKAAQ